MTMRYVAATAVLASMAIHLILWFQFMHEDKVLGPAFLVNVVAGVVIAVLLVRWHHWLPGVLSACFGMATLGAFTLATTVGLFGTHEHWTGFYVWGAAIAEVTAVLAGCAVVLEDPDTDETPPLHRGGRPGSEAPQSASSSGPAS
jgi:hypothetical protein